MQFDKKIVLSIENMRLKCSLRQIVELLIFMTIFSILYCVI